MTPVFAPHIVFKVNAFFQNTFIFNLWISLHKFTNILTVCHFHVILHYQLRNFRNIQHKKICPYKIADKDSTLFKTHWLYYKIYAIATFHKLVLLVILWISTMACKILHNLCTTQATKKQEYIHFVIYAEYFEKFPKCIHFDSLATLKPCKQVLIKSVNKAGIMAVVTLFQRDACGTPSCWPRVEWQKRRDIIAGVHGSPRKDL